MSSTSTCEICGLPFESRTSYGLCPLCWEKSKLREYDRLHSAKYHAGRAQVPATLTLVQWLSVVSDFKGLCAYCLEVPFSVIEQVSPLAGLIYENVVPACKACHKIKRTGFEQAHSRVLSYLTSAQRGESVDVSCDLDGVFS